jgi:NAD(P)-dependent dehydrogenase (short-subunit alcohol dehydrogenase family)
MNFDLTGKVAVVTGALGKLGSVWSAALLEAGASVIATDHPDALDSTDFDILVKKYGSENIRLWRADVTKRESLAKLKSNAEKIWGTANILVNNAGIDVPPSLGQSYRIEDIPAELFLPVLQVNVFGAFLVSQVFGGEMVKKGQGCIVNIGSLYGSVSPDVSFYSHFESDPPFLKPPAYAASKAGVIQLTKYLATHWGPHGVRVNTLSPGGVEGGQDAEFKKKFCSRVPLRRMAEADDLKGPLIFLASNASSYITGHNLQVEGGFSAW